VGRAENSFIVFRAFHKPPFPRPLSQIGDPTRFSAWHRTAYVLLVAYVAPRRYR
jgi:hypothetical protein